MTNVDHIHTIAAEEVAIRVHAYITTRHIGDIALKIDNARIHLHSRCWNIPIHWSEPLFPYYEALAEIEDQVQE